MPAGKELLIRCGIRTAATLLVTLSCFLAGCKHAAVTSVAGGSTPSSLNDGRETATAIVETVYRPTRQITLRLLNEHAQMHTFVCGPEVQNFSQIAKGDRVEAKYYEATAIEVRPARANSALRSCRVAANQLWVTGSVDQIDRVKQIITLRDAAGRRKFVKLCASKTLKVGDQVVIIYTEARVVALKELE